MTEASVVTEDLKRTGRALYSLMPSGLHGRNGLDPETSIHLLQIYVTLVLIYGMAVMLPRGKHLNTYREILKKISETTVIFYYCRSSSVHLDRYTSK